MSLEEAIQANTAAILALTAAWLDGPGAAKSAKGGGKKAEASAAGSNVVALKQPEPAAEPTPLAAAAAPAEPEKPATLEELRSTCVAMLTKLGQKEGEPALLEILKEYGATKMTEVPEEARREVIAKVEALNG